WLWRTYYHGNLPTIKKKLKVMSDWTMDLIYKPDVSMIKKQTLPIGEEQQEKENAGEKHKDREEKKKSSSNKEFHVTTNNTHIKGNEEIDENSTKKLESG